MIKGITADIIISAYLLLTLFFRFTLESQLAGHPVISIVFGLILLLVPVFLIKFSLFKPSYFGFFKEK